MTKLHFDDLTQITCPFGMLDDDTQERLKACDEVEFFRSNGWYHIGANEMSFTLFYTYRAKPKPKRLVSWVQWDDTWGSFAAETLGEAKEVQRNDGGYIYRISRNEDGSDPQIELVATGGKDE